MSTTSDAAAYESESWNRKHYSGGSVVIFALCVDLSVFCLGAVALGFFGGPSSTYLRGGAAIGLASCGFLILMAQFHRLYRMQSILRPEERVSDLARVSLLSSFGLLILLLLAYPSEVNFRTSALAFFFLFPFLFVGSRFAVGRAVKEVVRSGVALGRRVILIGDRTELACISEPECLSYGLNVLARVYLDINSFDVSLTAGDLASASVAVAQAREFRADEIAVVLPWRHRRAIEALTETLCLSPLPVRLYPDLNLREMIADRHRVFAHPEFAIDLKDEPLSRAERSVKRIVDVLLAGGGLLGLFPLLLMVAVLVKLDSRGPVFFRQRRRGFDQKEFRIWKFRTMRVMEDGATVRQARRDDDRVTAIGRLLRRTSIDEVPQLLNVLVGDMSIVGPRPHAISHDERYGELIDDYAKRYVVKPGLTGLAQVEGLRGETRTLDQMERRIERDIWYIRNWSFWLDIKIIAHTFVAVAKLDAF
jgi:undecaprenyl-phosphate galactose phosphotransferase/putative colanic acid biosynthesis UDP-glucose lipid carrier transferase